MKKVVLLFTVLVSGCGYHKTESFSTERANNREVKATGETEIIAAMSMDDPAALEAVLATGWSIDHRFADGQSLLIRAVSLGKVRIVEFLVRKGAGRAFQDSDGKDACAHAGSNAELRSLLECPADPAIVAEAFEAVRSGNIRKAQQLLKDGLDPNLRDTIGAAPGELGDTLLLAAVRAGQSRLVTMMVRGFRDRGLNLDLRDRDGRTPLSLAIELGHSDIERVLRAAGATTET